MYKCIPVFCPTCQQHIWIDSEQDKRILSFNGHDYGGKDISFTIYTCPICDIGLEVADNEHTQ